MHRIVALEGMQLRKTTRYLLGLGAVVVALGGGTAAYFIAKYGINPYSITRPAGTNPFVASPAALLETGELRHGDTGLSPIGRSCNTCHLGEDSYNETFNVPYPHYVRSVRWKTGLSRITVEGMVQFCMVSAMLGKPLHWDSEALAALTAFVIDRHERALTQAPAGAR